MRLSKRAYVERAGLPAADIQKLEYALKMGSEHDPFECEAQVEPTILEVGVAQ